MIFAMYRYQETPIVVYPLLKAGVPWLAGFTPPVHPPVVKNTNSKQVI